MRKFTLIITSAIIVHHACAQVVGGQQGKGLDMQTQANGFVTQLPAAPPEITGDSYLESNWSNAVISLYDNTQLEDYSVRLDLKNNAIEINHQGQIKVLSGVRVKDFTWQNGKSAQTENFINARGYTINNTPVTGFLKVVQEGTKWNITSKTYVRLVEGAYVAALDAGDKKSKFVKEEVYFLAFDKKLYQSNLPKKKFVAQFDSEIQSFLTPLLKEKKLNPKSKIDLVSIASYLNEYQKG